MLKAVLFDFDGAIVNSLRHHLYAYRQAFSHFGKNPSDEEIVRNVFDAPSEEAQTLNYGISDTQKFRDLFWHYLNEAFKELELHQNLLPALIFLNEKGIKLGIISASNSERIKRHIRPLKISHYFDFVLGRNDVRFPKPHPEIAKRAMKICKVTPEETLLVGDTDFDIETGKKAKVMTSLFTSEANLAYIHPDFYGKVKADFEFKNFSELPEKISRFL